MMLIIRKDKLFTHIGIFIDETYILHYSSISNNLLAKDKIVKRSNLKDFSNARNIKILEIEEEIDIKVIEERVEEFEKRDRAYHLIKNNCYSFVLWVLYELPQTDIKTLYEFTKKYKIGLLASCNKMN